MSSVEKVAVIGAGIVGVSTALWLQRAGCHVVLIDREGPAAGTSYGNAGLLASAAVIPVTMPGLLKKAPKMLLSPNEPLFLRWSYLPRLLPFLSRYLRYCDLDKATVISKHLHTMLHDSPQQHHALADGTAAADYIRDGNYIYGYKDKAAFKADATGWAMRKSLGFRFHELDRAGLTELDPALRGRFGYGVVLPAHGSITDPGAYVRALAAHFVEQGGEIVTATVTGFAPEQGRAVKALSDAGEISADAFVLTTGVWSGTLGKALGITIPLESERGYHVEFHNPNIMPKHPVMVAAGKFVLTPMQGRLRAAGTVEFGGLDAPASRAPVELLTRQVKSLFPDLTWDRVTDWMGQRPSTPDSLPVIGQSPKLKNVYIGYGHQHVGLTGGPKTGRWIAQMITGTSVNEDLTPYSPTRSC